MNEKNPIVQKSFLFALKIVALYRYLLSQKEFVLSKQMLKSGISIGANVTEAQDAQSKKDFISKMSISFKEVKETRYWLQLLQESGYIALEQQIAIRNGNSFTIIQLLDLQEELIKMLVSIVKISRQG